MAGSKSPNELIELTRHLSNDEANFLVTVLRDHEIDAFVFDEGVDRLGIGMALMAGGAKVRVPRGQLDAAQKLLKDAFPNREKTPPEWAEKNKAEDCKFCGSKSLKSDSFLRIVGFIFLLLANAGYLGFLFIPRLRDSVSLNDFTVTTTAVVFFSICIILAIPRTARCQNQECGAKYHFR